MISQDIVHNLSQDFSGAHPVGLFPTVEVGHRDVLLIRSDRGLAIPVGQPTRNSSAKVQTEGSGDRAERWRIGFDSDLPDQPCRRSIKDRPALMRPESESVSDAGIEGTRVLICLRVSSGTDLVRARSRYQGC